MALPFHRKEWPSLSKLNIFDLSLESRGLLDRKKLRKASKRQHHPTHSDHKNSILAYLHTWSYTYPRILHTNRNPHTYINANLNTCIPAYCILGYLHYLYTWILTLLVYLDTLHTCIFAYLHICILPCAYLHTWMLTYLHTCILAYLHTCILAYLHTCTLSRTSYVMK